MLREILFVAVGGALGALARYAVGLGAARLLGQGFPWGTLAVNVAGCFLMGLVLALLLQLGGQPQLTPAIKAQLAFWKQGVAIGFLGGLTTFSSFGADTLREFQAGRPALALANIAANVICSLAAVWAGWVLMQTFFGPAE